VTPLDLKTEKQWKEILEGFAKDTRMTACLTDKIGKQIICVADRFPLCATVRENPDALMSICSQTNTAMLAVVNKTKQPEVDICEAGLIRAVVPVVKNDALIGQITVCGVASHDEELDSFLVSKEAGISEDKVEELAKATPFGSEEELQAACSRLFENLSRS
jgi:ligand-binding sensor protein